jgi:hypothetical protein
MLIAPCHQDGRCWLAIALDLALSTSNPQYARSHLLNSAIRINCEICHLRAFQTVVELESFHRASEALNISQPALIRRTLGKFRNRTWSVRTRLMFEQKGCRLSPPQPF